MQVVFNRCLGCMSEEQEGAAFCPDCGWDIAGGQNAPHQLKISSILNGKYVVGKALGQGGFGITYIGWDINLHVKVAIKEYYPDGMVTRELQTQTTIHPFVGDAEVAFERGRAGFVSEAQTVAQFAGQNCIVSVKDFFLENGTAYIVMEYIDGITLKEYLYQYPGSKMPGAQVLKTLRPLFSGLQSIHDAGLLHRDISPDNIMVLKGGDIKLLDFGAAREMSAQGEKSTTVNVKHGFAPEEQYRTHGEQGSWTDEYALAATIYRMITGVTPMQSLERVVGDVPLKSPIELGAEVTPQQSAAILKALSVKGKDRFADIREFERALYEEGAFDYNNEPTASEGRVEQGGEMPVPKKNNGKLIFGIIGGVVAVAAVLVAVFAGGTGVPEPSLTQSPLPEVGEESAQPATEQPLEEVVAVAEGDVELPDIEKFYYTDVREEQMDDTTVYSFDFPGVQLFYDYAEYLRLNTDLVFAMGDGLSEGEILRVTQGEAMVHFMLEEDTVSIVPDGESEVEFQAVPTDINYANNAGISVEQWLKLGVPYTDGGVNYTGMIPANYANGALYARQESDVYIANRNGGNMIFVDASANVSSPISFPGSDIAYVNYLNAVGDKLYFLGGSNEEDTDLYMTDLVNTSRLFTDVSSFIVIGEYIFFETNVPGELYKLKLNDEGFFDEDASVTTFAGSDFLPTDEILFYRDASGKIASEYMANGEMINLPDEVSNALSYTYYAGTLYFINVEGDLMKWDTPMENLRGNLEKLAAYEPVLLAQTAQLGDIDGLCADAKRVYFELDTGISYVDIITGEIIEIAKGDVENPQPVTHIGQEWLFYEDDDAGTLALHDFLTGETSHYFG